MGEIVLEQADLAEYRAFPLSRLSEAGLPASVCARVAEVNAERIEEQGEAEAIGWCLLVDQDVTDLVTLTVFFDNQLSDGGEYHMLLPGALLWMRQNEFDTSFVPVEGYPDPAWSISEGAAPEVWALTLVGLSDEALATLAGSREEQEEDLYRGLIICRYLLRIPSFPQTGRGVE